MSEEKLPRGWKILTISKIGKVVTGNTPSKSNPEFFDGNIPWVKPGDVKKSRIIFQTEETLTELGAEKARLIPTGSVIVTCIGDLGNVTIAGKEVATNQQINSIVVDEKIAEFKYIYYWALTLKGWLIENSTSTTISMVNKSKFENAPVILPPLPEQQRIVAKLDAVFGHLDRIEARFESIKKLKDQLIDAFITDTQTGKFFIPKILKNFIEEGTERIGENWPNKFKVGVSAREGVIELETGQKSSFENYKIVRPGDFVYNAMRVNIGSIVQYRGNEIGITSPDYIVFRIKHSLSPKLLLNWLKSENGILQINSNTKGSVRSRLYFKNLANVNYPIAPEKTQIQAEKILGWYQNLESYQTEKLSRQISELRQSILAKAFRGELVRQEVKEYVREVGELGMVAEEASFYNKK